MANDQLITSDDPDLFLEYVLRCALTAPGATTSPTAGRILARLLVVGAIEGGDDLITPYLVPVPDQDATFEVRTYQPGDLVPTDVREGLRAAAALKTALRGARESDEGIEVVSRAASGLERCVLVRDSTGDFEFRFASSETLIGEPADCAAARSAWDATLSSWRGWMPSDDAPEARPSGAAPPGSGRLTSRPAKAADLGDPDSRLGDRRPPENRAADGAPPVTGWWVPPSPDDLPATGEQPVVPPATAATRPEGRPRAEPQSAPRAQPQPRPEPEAPAGGPLGPDVHEPAAAAPSTAAPGYAEPSASETRGGAASDPVNGALSEPLSDAIREAISNLVVEVDLGQVEQLIRRVLDDDRREFVEPLARRLSARLGESLDLPDTTALVEAVSRVVPRPGELAEAVAADVGALLSETLLRRRPGDPVLGGDGLHLMAGVEQLQVRLDGLHDQLQKSAGLLQVMGDHLEAGDRRAAVAERISVSVDGEMQRLASRIDEQVAAMAANAGGGSELADGVARLTRKLRQSVTQLDRALARLDDLFDQANGGGLGRAAPARGGDPSIPPLPRRRARLGEHGDPVARG